MGKIESSKDLIMLLLYAKGASDKICDSVKGKTRLMKMVFLFDKEIRKQFNLEKSVDKIAIPEFVAHDFGPFSANVYQDLEFLVNAGFVTPRLISSEPEDVEKAEYSWWQPASREDLEDFNGVTEFSLTNIGKGFVEEELKSQFSQKQWEIINGFKAKCVGVSLNALLKYVYTKYPEMTGKSKIKHKILDTE